MILTTPKGYLRDAAHKQLVPNGSGLAEQLITLYTQIRQYATDTAIAGRFVRLGPFRDRLEKILEGYLVKYAQNGAKHSLMRIAALQKRKGKQPVRGQKDIDPDVAAFQDNPFVSLMVDWGFLNQYILESVRTAAFSLASSTLATATVDANTAIREARQALRTNITTGEGHRALSQSMAQIFEPVRAFRIAQTESSRAAHQGAMLAAEESGVVGGLQWLASSDACPKCLAVNKKIVPLGKPFVVTNSGPYGTVYHPPYHPHCFCTILEVLKEDMPKK